MGEVYVNLNEINTFIKERNLELNKRYINAFDPKDKFEAKLRLEEIHYIMNELPRVVYPSIVFAEVENGER